MNKQILEFKNPDDLEDLCYVRPELLTIIAYVAQFCSKNRLACVLTSIIDDTPGRKSSTHLEGRAFDLRTRDWPDLMIYKLKHEVNKKFKKIAATRSSTGLPVAAIYHKIDGNEYHLHFQVKRT